MEAIYAGSFDPFTNGHMEIVAQASNVFDKVVVLIADNPEKRHWLPAEERRRIVQEAVGVSADAEILPQGDVAVEYAYRRGACLVRGLGDFTDYPAEKTLYGVNNRLRPEVETVFLMTRGESNQMRSSSVREALKYRFGWRSIRDAVPHATFNAVVLRSLQSRDGELERLIGRIDLSRYFGRPYHNLEHLIYMFDLAERWGCEDAGIDRMALWTAILYHDIYVDSDPDVLAGDDIRRSVERLRADAALIPAQSLDESVRLLLATDHKANLFNPNARMTPEMLFMCRLDFAILGESRYEYSRYALAVRNEYGTKYGYLSEIFRAGRKAFLENLLTMVGERRLINADYDEQMRHNARWELDELEKGR